MKYTKTDIAYSLKELQRIISVDGEVCTVLQHVSSSGMCRRIKVLIATPTGIQNISYQVAHVCGYALKDDAVRVSGCGMDMGFHVVNSLQHALGYSKYSGISHRWL